MGEILNSVALALVAIGVAVTAEPEPHTQGIIRVVVHGGHHRITKEVIQRLVKEHHPCQIRFATVHEIKREEHLRWLLAPRRVA